MGHARFVSADHVLIAGTLSEKNAICARIERLVKLREERGDDGEPSCVVSDYLT